MLPFAEIVPVKITKSELNGTRGCQSPPHVLSNLVLFQSFKPLELDSLRVYNFSYNEEK